MTHYLFDILKIVIKALNRKGILSEKDNKEIESLKKKANLKWKNYNKSSKKAQRVIDKSLAKIKEIEKRRDKRNSALK